MTLPEIPDEAVDALLHSFSPHPDEWGPSDRIVNRRHVEAVWPYLYAAALRHAAHDPHISDPEFGCDCDEMLLRLADEATP